MAFLEIRGVTKSFGATDVLHRVDLAVEEGDFLVLVGPSGCGKTTLLNMVAGLEQVSSGEIAIKERVVNDVHPSQRNIAMVFQSYALYPNMTVAQNITFGLEMHRVPRPEREARMREVAELLQIGQLLARRPSQLSGGQRQRVAMGRALVRKPDVFLFDEPLSNLDAKLRVTMRTEIKKLHQRLGATIFYVTHDQVEAMTLSTKIAVMDGGYVQQFGTPKEIYDQPANVFVATFMGSPAMNLLPATVADGHAVLADGQRLRLANAPAGAERRALLGLRPEHLAAPDDAAAGLPRLKGKISVIEPAGSDTYAVAMVGDCECSARLRADAPVQPGTEFEFACEMAKASLFDPASGKRIA